MTKIFAVWDEEKNEIALVGYGVNKRANPFYIKKNAASAAVTNARNNGDPRKLRVVSYPVDTEHPIFE